MNASDEDRRALSQALRKVTRLAQQAETLTDAEAVRSAMWAVRGAAIDAFALTKAIEETTRAAAMEKAQ